MIFLSLFCYFLPPSQMESQQASSVLHLSGAITSPLQSPQQLRLFSLVNLQHRAPINCFSMLQRGKKWTEGGMDEGTGSAAMCSWFRSSWRAGCGGEAQWPLLGSNTEPEGQDSGESGDVHAAFMGSSVHWVCLTTWYSVLYSKGSSRPQP